jgi:hypothetical protein
MGMEGASQEAPRVSRLGISIGRRSGTPFRKTCDATAAMRCKSCAEVFYARHYEEHWCFKTQIDIVKSSEIERIKRAKQDRRSGCVALEEEYEDVVLTPSEMSVFGNRQALETLLNIRPVMTKIWRSPSIYCRMFGNKGAAEGKHLDPPEI